MFDQQSPDPQEFTAADHQELMALLTPRLIGLLRKSSPEIADQVDEIRRGFADPFDDEGQSPMPSGSASMYQGVMPPGGDPISMGQPMVNASMPQPMVQQPAPGPIPGALPQIPGGPLPPAPPVMADPAGGARIKIGGEGKVKVDR